MRAKANLQVAVDPAQALTKAVVKAAGLLELTQSQLAGTLGLSSATVSRMFSGQYQLSPERKEWELAALFVRLFRSLDSITGGQDEASRAWLHNRNHELLRRPVDMLGEVTGLVQVVDYLDSYRARV
ncbi:MAG: antitoxin Xre-like helix-turn-helix domain-containing protein [Bryobacter sp.]|nr:antitoxin Xre-like helix-turn-helix domain-containing protein [Bryobacter sp.]